MGTDSVRSTSSVFLCLAATLCASCERYAAGDGTPLEVTKCFGEGGGYAEWGQMSSGLYATALKPYTAKLWQWRDGSLSQTVLHVGEDISGVLPLTANTYIAKREPKTDHTPWPVMLVRTAPDEVLGEWRPAPGGWFPNTGGSRNGKFAAIGEGPDTGDGLKLGLIDVSKRELRWAATLEGHGAGTVRTLVASDDGALIAVGGWNNGVAIIDVAAKKALWAKRPPREINTSYVVFAPDNKTVYAGGSEGCVYGMDVGTGKIMSRWFTNNEKKRATGRRVSCLAVSPDGRYVAAGTGPEGQVFVWDTKTGGTPRMFNHGVTTVWVVSFSPDSKYMATFSGGWIKTWDLAK